MTGHAAAAGLIAAESKLLACVHCGFCLPACPTFTRLGDEADSPRGRLDLMRAVMDGRLEPGDPAVATHLDRCLGCRACETACPSGVEYGFLLERAREAVAGAGRRSASRRVMLALFRRPWLYRPALAAGRMLRRTRMPRLLLGLMPARFGRLRFGLAMLAATEPWPLAGSRPAAARMEPEEGAPSGPPARPRPSLAVPAGPAVEPIEPIGPAADAASVGSPRVALLRGCVQAGLFGTVGEASALALRANGCDVVPAPRQGCCGALHAHGGDLEAARALARTNVEAFGRAGADLVVVDAAGCGAAMKEYGELLADDPAWAERARAFAARVRDIHEILADRGPRPGGAVPVRVAYDAPCHLHHGQRVTAAPLRVLDAVPGLERVPLAGAEECCGGAGTYGLLHPELGGRILADKLAAIRAAGAEAVVTPNPGCIMQIRAGLLLAGDATPVLHPMELLAESYRRAGVR